MGPWVALAMILAGGVVFFAFWLGKSREKRKFLPSLNIGVHEDEKELVEDQAKSSKMVELRFSDGSKLVLDENSPYYQDFLDYADKILSKEEENAKERAHGRSA